MEGSGEGEGREGEGGVGGRIDGRMEEMRSASLRHYSQLNSDQT